jgi:hypothetical protein
MEIRQHQAAISPAASAPSFMRRRAGGAVERELDLAVTARLRRRHRLEAERHLRLERDDLAAACRNGAAA